MNISSNFLLLHVKEGRHELFEHFKRGENPLHPCARICGCPWKSGAISTGYAAMMTASASNTAWSSQTCRPKSPIADIRKLRHARRQGRQVCTPASLPAQRPPLPLLRRKPPRRGEIRGYITARRGSSSDSMGYASSSRM